MIFDKQVVFGLGVAYAASPFSRVDAVALPHVAAETGDEKSPLDTIARKLADKAGKAGPSSGAGHSDTSKGGKNPPSSSKAHKDPTTPFFVTSASCAGDCMSASYGPDSHFLTNAIQPCDANSLHQQWELLQHGTFTMMKNVGASADSTDDWCVGVVQQGDGLMCMRYNYTDIYMPEIGFQLGASTSRISSRWVDYDMCSSGAKLGLVRCGDPASEWYPTDSQLLSGLCWSHGVTSLLTAEGCNELSLSTTTATDGATASITRADTFMVIDKEFIESIVAPTPSSTMKPIKVYILLGQSNMLGFGRIEADDHSEFTGPEGSLSYAVKEKGLYPYLIDEEGNWTVRNDVRDVQVLGSGLGEKVVLVNDWLTINPQKNRPDIGPEVGIGHVLAQAMDDERVLLLKSCIGNRALGWDLLPPCSEEYEFTDSNNVTWIHSAYGGSPERWQKGTTPEKLSNWYAGIQYDGDISRAQQVLNELNTILSWRNRLRDCRILLVAGRS